MKAQAEILTETPYKNGFLLQIIAAEPAGFLGACNVTITKPGKKRSLDANGYYWVLVDKIATDRNEPRPKIHNMLLRDYGTLERMDDYLIPVMFPDTQETFDALLLKETYHVAPTSEVTYDESGNGFRTYYVIKGSHEYDVEEMRRLIDGTVEEAKNLGIETATPEELERMERLYAENKKVTR